MAFTIPTVSDKKERRRIYHRAWQRANKDKIRVYSKKERDRQKADPVLLERERARQRLVKSKRNPDDKAAYQRDFHRKNPDYRRLWKARAALNPRYIIENRLRTRMHNTLKGRIKSETTFGLLGCNRDQFKQHIESLFVHGMNWGNRHLWHIDHIRPCASFDLLDPEQQRCCFHFTNLQPLWAADNMKKSDKWEDAQ